MSHGDHHENPFIHFLNEIKNHVATWIGNCNWTTKHVVTTEERERLMGMLKPNYFIILTRHDGHLSAYAISFAHWVLTKFKNYGYYGHALMNLEDEVKDPNDFRLVEATGIGVHYSTFDEAFDPQLSSFALLKPKSMSLDDWTLAMDKAKSEVGKPYDTLFDLKNDRALSCVELVRVALQATPNYETEFANFEKMIKECKNLDPHMFYECPDFEIVYEVRH